MSALILILLYILMIYEEISNYHGHVDIMGIEFQIDLLVDHSL